MQSFLTRFNNFMRQFGYLPLLHAGAVVFVYLMLYLFDMVHLMPANENVTLWDAGWYMTIKNSGYSYYWYMASNSAFFPLFPYLWRLLHADALTMCLINYLIFLAGLYLLQRTFRISQLHTFLFMTLPACIFFYLPYTEAIFFLACALFLTGLQKEKMWLVVFGLFLSSTSRATAMFFVPAIICMELFSSEKWFTRKMLRNIFIYSAASLAGLMLVVFIQYYQTWEWFAFVKQQTRFWKHTFSWPTWPPFVSYGGDKIIWLDGSAFFFGIVATMLLITFFIKYCMRLRAPIFTNKAFWFSATYVFMVTMYSIMFNHKSGQGYTELQSINRYLFCTAFFYLFYTVGLQSFSFSKKHLLIYGVCLLLCCVLLGFGIPLEFLVKMFESQHRTTIFLFFLAAYLGALFAVSHPRWGDRVAVALCCLHVFLSVYTLNMFINGKWVA
jgi:hypothetical protein